MSTKPPTTRPETSTSAARHSISRKFLAVLSALIALVAILLFSPLARGALATRQIPSTFPRNFFPATRFASTVPNPNPIPPAMTTQKYTPAEERQWNSLATNMDRYHNHFRYEFNRVYTLCDGGFHKEGMSLARFLRQAQELAQHLDMHHKIEAYIFPLLAKKMPQFKAGAREGGEHLKSHKAIHEGLDKYEAFLAASLANSSSYSPATLREIMDGFREVLFRHLDEEVHDLGGESMRAAGWTLKELKQFPM